ncbi:MAG: hypothetical protein DME76_00025 [Verrucomicrobia bacterium]|nr:MAG: hypothetical protein DME76_00025 [Verrucomicrobiota bacterium]
MPADFTWQITAAVVALVALIGYLWFRTPTIVFGYPENIADQIFLKWWHLPIEIRPVFFQRKLLNDCAISVYVHGGGAGTIVNEIGLCWQTADGTQTTVKIEKNGKYYAPVSLRSTHWTKYSLDVNRNKGLSLALPPRIAFFCDQEMMLAARIPMSGLSNDYYLSFRVHRSGKTLQRSGLYKLAVPFQRAENSEFTFEKL